MFFSETDLIDVDAVRKRIQVPVVRGQCEALDPLVVPHPVCSQDKSGAHRMSLLALPEITFLTKSSACGSWL